MKRYLLEVEGTNIALEMVGNTKKKYGFFANRVIKGESFEHAAEIALRLIREEIKNIALNEMTDPPVFRVAKVKELAFWENPIGGQGRGHSWYPERDDLGDD